MPLPAVLFDLGGTLLDYGPAARWPAFRVQRMTELHPIVKSLCGGVPLPAAEFGRAVGQALQTEEMRAIEHSGRSLPFADRLKAALLSVGLEPDCRALDRLVEAFSHPIRSWPRPYPDTKPALDRLHSLGAKMAIITNAPWDTPGRMLHADLQRWELSTYFSAFIASGDVPWRKPNPNFMWAAAKALGVPPEQCIVVGDNLMADIGGARAAGMRSVWISREGDPIPAHAPQPDWVAATIEGALPMISRPI